MIPLRQRLSERLDDGETLVELIITIVIVGVIVVALGSAMVLSVRVSSIHRAQSDASAFLHNYAESVQSTPYIACTAALAPDYVTSASLATPSEGGPWVGNQPSVTVQVMTWEAASQSYTLNACPLSGAAVDSGLQRITLNLTSADSTVEESLVIVKREPS